MRDGRVVVVGSVNMDVIAQVPRLPRAGETLAGTAVQLLPGGKGANQAVAAARAGAAAALVGAVGTDELSAALVAFLTAAGVDLGGLARVDGPAGTAVILVDDAGENSIVVIPGANAQVSPEQVDEVALAAADVVLLQQEIPAAANLRAARRAREYGARTVLNLAPYRPPADDLLAAVDYLILNETEFAQLTGADGDAPPELPAAVLPGLDVVVTLGAAGVRARLAGYEVAVAAHPVPVLDTTGAGDCFCGAFGAALAGGQAPAAALGFANAAAALSVQRRGAAPAMPTGAEIAALLQPAG
jgi:ribokinase